MLIGSTRSEMHIDSIRLDLAVPTLPTTPAFTEHSPRLCSARYSRFSPLCRRRVHFLPLRCIFYVG